MMAAAFVMVEVAILQSLGCDGLRVLLEVRDRAVGNLEGPTTSSIFLDDSDVMPDFPKTWAEAEREWMARKQEERQQGFEAAADLANSQNGPSAICSQKQQGGKPRSATSAARAGCGTTIPRRRHTS